MDEQINLFHLKSLKSIFRRRKKVFLVVSSAILAATAIFVIVIPRVYVSQSTILIEQMIPADYMKGTSPTFMDERLQFLTQQIISREKLLDIARQYNLYTKVMDKTDEEKITKKMKEDIQIKTISASDVTGQRSATVAFTLAYQYEDPVTAQQVASTLADLFLEKNIEEREKRVSKTALVLQQTVDELKEQLDDHSKKLNALRMSHPGELPDSIPFNNEQIAKLNSQLDQTTANLKVQQEKRDLLQSQMLSMLATTSGGSNANVSQSLSLRKLRTELTKLQMKYSDKHPDVIRTKKQIETLEKRLENPENDKEVNRSSTNRTIPRSDEPDDPSYINMKIQLATSEMEVKSLNAQRNEIRQRIDNYQRKNEKARLLEAEYSKLVQVHDNAQKKYNEIMNKLLEAKAAKGVEETQPLEKFTIIEKAQIPQTPEKSRRLRIIITGIFLSLFAGIFAMIVAENFDHSVKSATELQNLTQLPVFSIIPYIMDEKEAAEQKKYDAFHARLDDFLGSGKRWINPLSEKFKK